MAVVVAGGPLVVLALFIEHLASYRGFCGPHAMDIPAYPCAFPEYALDFAASPFALVGLTFYACGGWLATAGIVGIGWTAWAVVHAVRSRH